VNPTLRVAGGGLLGESVTLPFEVKLLDVGDRLSVQVHPDDAEARAHGLPVGKDEAWVVLAAGTGARVAAGFRSPLTPQALADACERGTLPQLLAWRDVVPGDVVALPAGTVHAAVGPVLLYEVHTPCDLTLRMYDWGRGRPLDIPAALRVARGAMTPARGGVAEGMAPPPHESPPGHATILVDGPSFSMARARAPAVLRVRGACAVTVVSGAPTLDGEPLGVVGSVVVRDAGRPRRLGGTGEVLIAGAAGALAEVRAGV
jgi:mannose-6-phosphate isomerase